MNGRPIVILKVGTTIPTVAARRGDFEAWITAAAGLRPGEVRVVDVRAGSSFPPAEAAAGFIITGSSAMVTAHEPWSVATAEWIPPVIERGTPLLGICYGHQLMADALRGRVERNPRGREIGTITVQLETEACERDLLFRDLGPALRAQATHVEAVTTLPPGARLLGGNAADPNQVFAVGERAWGVQFHPEFDADIIRGYIAARRDAIRSEGADPDALIAAAKDSDDGRSILRRFAELCRTLDD